jgi:Putative adhesin
MQRTFDNVTGPLTLDLRVQAGSIVVAAGGTNQVEVELEPLNEAARQALDAVVIDLRARADGHVLVVEVPEWRGMGFLGRGREFDLRVRCPESPHVKVRSASADFAGRGALASLEVKTASGDAEAEQVEGEVRLQSASGDVELAAVGGTIDLNTASGDVTIGRADGAVRARLVSGDLALRDARDSVEVQTVSGDQRLEAVSAGAIGLGSVSGDIRVGVRQGTNVWMDIRSLSGDTTSELTPTDGPTSDDAPLVELRIKSVSGDVQIESAAASPLEA